MIRYANKELENFFDKACNHDELSNSINEVINVIKENEINLDFDSKQYDNEKELVNIEIDEVGVEYKNLYKRIIHRHIT